MKLTLIIIAAFAIWFSSIWIAVLSLLSIIGGWKTLSRLYPLPPSDRNINSLKYSMSSMKMGFVNYRSCAVISFTQTGIIFEVMKIFSLMHKPFYIPYSRITGLKRGKIFFSAYTSFIVENKKIVLYGKAGEELFSRLGPSSGIEKSE